MKDIILLVFCLVFSNSYCQDTLYYLNGQKEVAKIIQINPKEIKYHFWGVNDGPEVIIDKGKVKKLVLSNGKTIEFLNPEDKALQKRTLKKMPILDFRRNTFGFSFTDLFTYRLGISYERILGKKGWFSVRVPFSVSLKDKKATFLEDLPFYAFEYDYYDGDQRYEMDGKNYNLTIPSVKQASRFFPFQMAADITSSPNYINYGNSFYTGLGGRCYFGGQKRKNFFFGLDLQGGIYTYSIQNYSNISYDEYGNVTAAILENPKNQLGGMVGYFLETGIRINSLTNRFSVTFSMGIGQRFMVGAPQRKTNYSRNMSPIDNSTISLNPQIQLLYSLGKKNGVEKVK
jgi:hypothetical protein